MKKYFTAVGKVQVQTLTETGYTNCECNFSHVVSADDSDDAHEKVLNYYIDKSTYYDKFNLIVVEIFDFIE
jgi:hypothetical protein